MKIDLDAYLANYIDKAAWQKSIKVLPVNSETASGYDKRCGMQGTTGEFFRMLENDGVEPIENFEESLIQPVIRYLETQQTMTEEKIKEFSLLLRDVLCVNGNLNITDVFFLKYLPLVPNDEHISPGERKKYKKGQEKLAAYLFSCIADKEFSVLDERQNNLFFSVLKDAIPNNFKQRWDKVDEGYYILPFIQESFRKDLEWLLSKEKTIVIKYIHLFLHFYVCYALTQAMVALSSEKNEKIVKPEPFFFVLDTEKVSVNHDAVIRGWNHVLPKGVLNKLFGMHQALDIANAILGGKVGFYPEVLAKLSETPFEDNCKDLEFLLDKYKETEIKRLARRSTGKHSQTDMDTSVNSYKEFLRKLEKLCVTLQSSDYEPRIRKKVVDIISCRFLKRGRGHYVLSLDKEMLIFLVALMTREVPKNKNMKLESVYKRFNSYGIHFNRGTRQKIEDYLLKLNILVRKSDSGEAQYVKSIL